MNTIDQLVRSNILGLKPYTSARTEYKGVADIFLDANENPYETGMNRYPDPLQQKLKNKIADHKNVHPQNIFLGNGSDEVIDLLIRIFCEPKEDHIITLPPTYGMYKVSADIANVGVKEIPLDSSFQPDTGQILASANAFSKLLFVCSPNNPTGNLIGLDRIKHLVEGFNGIVVVDEAYIDFAEEGTTLSLVNEYTNLVVMQTFSKAWGLAGIRLGMAFTNSSIIHYLNKVKPPYNINSLTQKAALVALERNKNKNIWVKEITKEREKLIKELSQFSFIQKIFHSDTNFLLVEVNDPDSMYQYLIRQKIIVRNRSKTLNCEGCLRFTVGTPEENQSLIQSLKAY